MHNKPGCTYCDVRIPTGSSELDQSYSMDYLHYFIYAFELLSYRDNKHCIFFSVSGMEVKKNGRVSGTASPES
jgi:hypothetical protein